MANNESNASTTLSQSNNDSIRFLASFHKNNHEKKIIKGKKDKVLEYPRYTDDSSTTDVVKTINVVMITLSESFFFLSLQSRRSGENDYTWKAQMNDENGRQFNSEYWIRVVCIPVQQNESSDEVHHKVEVFFEPPGDCESNEKERAKHIFDDLSRKIKTSIIRSQFPAFPGGSSGRPFTEIYQINEMLKSGGFGTVCRGTHRETGIQVAIKLMFKQRLSETAAAAIYEEVSIMSSLCHKNVVSLIDFFEDKDCFYVVMELMEGGDLFDRLAELNNYNENDARKLCRKLLEAVAYCHQNHVAHCDLKHKNILLKSKDDKRKIKIADFGFATRVTGPRSLSKRCGTPYFIAPEIIRGEMYDESADMWSVGVLIYLLIGGQLPFNGSNQSDLFRRIVRGNYDFPQNTWRYVSLEAKQLIRNLLKLDVQDRFSASQALQSDWFRKTDFEMESNDLSASLDELKVFKLRPTFRGAAMAVVGLRSMSHGGTGFPEP